MFREGSEMMSAKDPRHDMRKPRPRVLLVAQYDVYPRSVGGLPIRGAEFARLLAPAFDVWVLTLAGLRSPAGNFRRLPLRPPALERLAHRWSWRLGRLAEAIWERVAAGPVARRLVRESRPDFLLFTHFERVPRRALRALLAVPAPVVAYFGNSLGDNLVRELRADSMSQPVRGTPRPVTLIFNCHYLRRYYQGAIPDHFGRRCGGGYPDHFRSEVIYNGVDTDRFRPAPVTPDPPVFAFLGRPVHPGKGFLDFCTAMTLLPAPLVGGIDVIGAGDQLEEGLAIIRAAGRGHLLRRAGFTSYLDVPGRLRQASVLVLPTRDDSIPNALTEAMASGLAVVSSRLAGIPELVRDGETGLLVEPGNIPQLVAACRRLAEDSALRRRLGAAARALVVRDFEGRASLEQKAVILAETFGHTQAEGGGAMVPRKQVFPSGPRRTPRKAEEAR